MKMDLDSHVSALAFLVQDWKSTDGLLTTHRQRKCVEPFQKRVSVPLGKLLYGQMISDDFFSLVGAVSKTFPCLDCLIICTQVYLHVVGLDQADNILLHAFADSFR